MYRRKVTAATLRRYQVERRGEGSDSSYVPGVQVRRSDPASRGRSSVENNPQLGRQHDLLSKFQSSVCLALRRSKDVKDILENHPFPLEPGEHPGQRWSLETLPKTTGSVAIANAKGLRHPVHPDADNSPKRLITPLLVSVQAKDTASPASVAILLSYAKEPDPPKPERKSHRLLYACWEAIDVEVLTCYRARLSETVHQNHIWLGEAERFGPDNFSDVVYQAMAFVECALYADWQGQSAYQVLNRIAGALNIPLVTCLQLYKHCLWFNYLTTDLTRPLWSLVSRHPKPTVFDMSLPDWHPLSKSRWLA